MFLNKAEYLEDYYRRLLKDNGVEAEGSMKMDYISLSKQHIVAIATNMIDDSLFRELVISMNNGAGIQIYGDEAGILIKLY